MVEIELGVSPPRLTGQLVAVHAAYVPIDVTSPLLSVFPRRREVLRVDSGRDHPCVHARVLVEQRLLRRREGADVASEAR